MEIIGLVFGVVLAAVWITVATVAILAIRRAHRIPRSFQISVRSCATTTERARTFARAQTRSGSNGADPDQGGDHQPGRGEVQARGVDRRRTERVLQTAESRRVTWSTARS